MERTQVANLSSSYSGAKVASVVGTTMGIWDLTTYSLENRFPVLFEHGAYRVVISNDGNTAIVGTWRVHGIGAYDTRTGQELWRRKDLKRCHRLIGSRDDLRVSCEFDDIAFRSLAMNSGKERQPLRGVEQVHESPFDDVVVQDRKKKTSLLLHVSGERIAELPRSHSGASAIAFAPGLVCMGGSTAKCYSTATGKLMWENALAQELKEESLACYAIAYIASLSAFALVVWPNSRGGDFRVAYLDATTGRLNEARKVEAASQYKFCTEGALLLTSSGTLFRSNDLTLIGSLPFHELA